MEMLVSYELGGRSITERAEVDEVERISKVAKGRGAKNLSVTLNKGLSKPAAISILKKKAASNEPDAVEAQAALREIFVAEVNRVKGKGVFDQGRDGQTILTKAENLAVEAADPKPADDLDTGDFVGDSDIEDSPDEYNSNPDTALYDEATAAWLGGDSKPARELGLSETDLETWLAARTRQPIKLEFGQSISAASVGNAQTAKGMDEAIEDIQAKGGSGKGALRVAGSKLARPSSFR